MHFLPTEQWNVAEYLWSYSAWCLRVSCERISDFVDWTSISQGWLGAVLQANPWTRKTSTNYGSSPICHKSKRPDHQTSFLNQFFVFTSHFLIPFMQLKQVAELINWKSKTLTTLQCLSCFRELRLEKAIKQKTCNALLLEVPASFRSLTFQVRYNLRACSY